MRPSVGGASRLIIRSKVDLPAPERPITPTKPPGSMAKEALSTAAFAPKRHVKPSTTSMQCSRRVTVRPALTPEFYSRVTIALRCGNRPHPIRMSRRRHDIVIRDIERHSNQMDHAGSHNGRQD